MKLLDLKQRFPETAKYLTHQQKRLRAFGSQVRQQWIKGKAWSKHQVKLFPKRWQSLRTFAATQSLRIKNSWDTLSQIAHFIFRLLARLFWFLFTIARIVVTIILTFIGAGLIAAVFVPENYELKRSIAVEQSPKEIFPILKDLEKRPQWDPWFKVDTSMTTKISGTRQGKKTQLSWDGDQMKEGQVQIKKINAPKSLQLESVSMEQYMTTLKPWQDKLPVALDFLTIEPLTATEKWFVEKTDSATVITRIETGKLDYPVERWIGLLMEQDLGARFDSSLVGLKRMLQ